MTTSVLGFVLEDDAAGGAGGAGSTCDQEAAAPT